MNKARILTAVMAGAVIAASAQDLTTEITVEAGVETGLPEASPAPTIYPEAPALSAPAMQLRPAQYTEASLFAPSAGDIATPLYTGIPAPEHYRGHAWAGYFPLYNLSAGAAYRLWEKAGSSIGIGARFDGADYKYEGQYNNTLRAGVAGSHTFGSSGTSLRVSADYLHSWLHFPTLIGIQELTQGVNHADIRASLRGSGSTTWHADIRYDMTSVTEGRGEIPTDHRLRVNGQLSRALRYSGSSFDLGAAFDMLNTHGTAYAYGGIIYSPARHTSMLITLRPAVRFTIGEHILAKAGVRLDVGINTSHRAINLAPDIYLGWRPSQLFEAYLTADGGERYFTLADQYRISPFYTGGAVSDATYTPVDTKLGINIHPLSGLSITLHGGYAATHHLPMPVRGYYPYGYLAATDISGWNAGLRATYRYRRLVDAHASLCLYPRGSVAKAYADAPDRAKIAIKAGVAVHPTPKWDVAVDYNFRGGRRVYWANLFEGSIGMGAVSDLSMDVRYKLRPNLTIFLRMTNMMARTWLETPFAGCRPFHGLAGVYFRF